MKKQNPPTDDGACKHLVGKSLPDITLKSTDDKLINLAQFGKHRTVLYLYPMIASPDVSLPADWDIIPGARGCTPQSCAFRDHMKELAELNAQVFGLSSQEHQQQKEAVARLHLPFPHYLFVHCWQMWNKLMRVPNQQSIRYQVLQRIQRLRSNIVLREDLADIAEDRQISRALNSLTEEGKLVKLGYGIYTRLEYSKLTKRTYLPAGFVTLAREALTRLDIPWEISDAEKAYNAGDTQQIPANPATKLHARFRRTLSYNGIKCRFE